ncbi:pectate lyase [Mangrovimonas sp. AS39]|uniref:pectate lyase n=1 Tax=Mangrovimonas futianensis TaxID=2895523 RepID=UPI001E4254C3|nr:pectate lyase [Mangrovimonas futianensis]MCF1190983.1 pectate lyase [Mangrovimonas futianensis]MCF1194679.1 pectate lyase [Mangrovimonas futianensis]
MKVKFTNYIWLLIFGFMGVSSLMAQVHDRSWKQVIYQKEASWFATNEAKQVAENVLLYQRDIGGWPKNVPMHLTLSKVEKKELEALKTTGLEATTDNGATTQEMLFLSKMYAQTADERYKKSFLQGLGYILEAQYENGGWPQFYPLKKGYYSHITYNDDSMVHIMNLLLELRNNSDYYSIKPSKEQLERVNEAFKKGIDCILNTQYKQNGILTGWCAQHDAVTLEPAKARAYELPSLSGAESVGIVKLLMSVENPSIEVINAVNSAVTWFENSKVLGLRQERTYDANGRVVDKVMIADKDAPPLWGRFMELDDNTPFFCDRDGVKKYKLSEIGAERRNGYRWYTDAPSMVLEVYPNWKKKYVFSKSKGTQSSHEIVVSKDGTGDYTSIQEAINNTKAFPYDRLTIFIKNGVYKEKIKVHEWNTNLSIIGESREGTIITYDDYFNKIGLGRNSTFYTYTLLVEANNVVLKNLTIENSSGEVGQAVALSVFSDEVAVINCKLLGNQDTLYASGKGKQYYKDCYIEGTTDFIFGSATAYFENCQIHSKKNSYVTAASTPQESEFGYVFKDCKLTADAGVTEVYLGRPWRIYAQTVFINCELGSHILPEGWHNWSKPEAEQTAFYGEYSNSGKGFAPRKRVEWSHQLTSKEAEQYTLKHVLGNGLPQGKKEWYEIL